MKTKVIKHSFRVLKANDYKRRIKLIINKPSVGLVAFLISEATFGGEVLLVVELVDTI